MVVCAVKLCRNYTGKNIKPPEGISFHRFPTDFDQKQEWILAIRREPDWSPGTHCRVCSVHFDNSDFKISETGRRILHKDAIPTKNLYQEERTDLQICFKKRVVKKRKASSRSKLETASDDVAAVLACRACLATDTKLFKLQDDLADSFGDLTGNSVSLLDGLPHHICTICYSLLYKLGGFKERCEITQSLLDEARTRELEITTDFIRNIDRRTHRLTFNLAIKKLPILDLTEIDIKQEHINLLDEDSNNPNNVDTSNFDDNHFDDSVDDAYDIFDEKEPDNKLFENNIKIETELGLNNENTEIYASEIAKSEIFVEVDAKKVKKGKKRKADCKRKSKKVKQEEVVKEDIRNTKARKTDEDYDNFAKAYSVDIVFLTREEQIAEVKARRETDNYKNSRFKCEECFKGFTGENAFKNHKTKHDPSIGNYVCEPCGFRFPKRYKMLHHLTHHKMNFTCKLCNHITKLPSKAKEHFKWHNGVKYPCHFCEKSFIKRTSQFNHMRNRHGSACCDICQEIFSGERGLSAHMIKAHKQAVKSRCDSCGVQFHTEEALSRHIDASPRSICDPAYRSCPQCGDNFPDEELLNEHSRENHWKEIKCEKCNANFENEKLYRMHRIVHKEFRERRPRSEPNRPKGLKAPKQRPKKPIKIQKRMCEMCGLTWRSSAALKYHQRVHTGEKPHQCPMCPKSFRIQDSLQIHMNTHTGARPFKCPHCPKAFKSRTQNHKHQLVHTKVRRYRCDLCDKSFQTSTCVKTHIRTVHMKIPAPPRARHRAAPPGPPAGPPAPPHYAHDKMLAMDTV